MKEVGNFSCFFLPEIKFRSRINNQSKHSCRHQVFFLFFFYKMAGSRDTPPGWKAFTQSWEAFPPGEDLHPQDSRVLISVYSKGSFSEVLSRLKTAGQEQSWFNFSKFAAPKIDYTDSDPFINGKIGFRSCNAHVHYNNFGLSTANK